MSLELFRLVKRQEESLSWILLSKRDVCAMQLDARIAAFQPSSSIDDLTKWSAIMPDAANKKELSRKEREEFLSVLMARFEANMTRHKGLKWQGVQTRLEAHPEKLWSLHEMERTGGEPDVVALDKKTSEYVFFDCSPESPAGRRSLCFDREAWNSRKQNKPKGSAWEFAEAMGIELLTEAEYRDLQKLGEFDLKTSSWIETPTAIRNLGGALFCDRRFDHVFVYHNGAESYYAARGFRGSLRV